MVWYQMFEYAVSHWLQKATEHVTGCVLCSPGCFSLFRGSAILKNNVLEKYTKEASTAAQLVQYDQGNINVLNCNINIHIIPLSNLYSSKKLNTYFSISLKQTVKFRKKKQTRRRIHNGKFLIKLRNIEHCSKTKATDFFKMYLI